MDINLNKQYIKIDTIFQEIMLDETNLLSEHFIDDVVGLNDVLTGGTLVIDTLYETINTNDISLDSLDQLLKLDGLIFEPDNKPCSDNVFFLLASPLYIPTI